MRRTVHLVYPHAESIRAPHVIGWELGKRLERSYRVVYHDWDGSERIFPEDDAVLIGHAHPTPGTTFRRSMRLPGWRRKILLEPFNHDQSQVAFLDRVIRSVDAFLAITGPYWFDTIDSSVFAHWQGKMVQVDLAVDPAAFPTLKTSFSPPGGRTFVYIGHSGWQKNVGYLSQLAERLPEVGFSWIGGGRESIPGVTPLGPMDFSTETGQAAVASHDFMITVGVYDSNPTTVLEAMAWGLVPVCTPQSGYYHNPGIINIPSDDVDAAADILRGLNMMDEASLRQLQARNREQLVHHYNWDRFATQVEREIESEQQRPMGPESIGRRWGLLRHELASPYSPLRPGSPFSLFRTP